MPAATVPFVSGSIRMNEPVLELRVYSSSSNGTWVRSVMRPSSLSFSAVAVLSRCSVLTSRRYSSAVTLARVVLVVCLMT